MQYFCQYWGETKLLAYALCHSTATQSRSKNGTLPLKVESRDLEMAPRGNNHFQCKCQYTWFVTVFIGIRAAWRLFKVGTGSSAHGIFPVLLPGVMVRVHNTAWLEYWLASFNSFSITRPIVELLAVRTVGLQEVAWLWVVTHIHYYLTVFKHIDGLPVNRVPKQVSTMRRIF